MPYSIRLAEARDGRGVADIYAPLVRSTAISFETETPDDSEMARRIEETLRLYPWLICEYGSQVAGYAYAARHRVRGGYRWSVDVSVYVHEAFRKRRVGKALYTSLLGILAAQRYVNAYAGITLPNAASVALHESMGFRPVGVYEQVGFKLGSWHDVGWWQARLRPLTPDPPAPEPLDRVRREQAWPVLVAAGLEVLID